MNYVTEIPACYVCFKNIKKKYVLFPDITQRYIISELDVLVYFTSV